MQSGFRAEAARTGADNGKRERGIVLLLSKGDGIADGVANGILGCSPESVDAGNMDDAAKRQLARGRENRLPQRYRAVLAHLPEWLQAPTLLDRPGNAVRPEQPPRDDGRIYLFEFTGN